MEVLKYGIMAIAPNCNQDCLFCFETPFRMRKKTLTLENVKEIADTLAARGFTRMVFIGGEATVIRDFPDMCRYISGLGMTVCLTTNGRMLSDESYVEKLFDAGLAHIEFSLHTHVAADADYLSSRKNTASRQKAALENIDKLISRYVPQPTLNTNTVLTTVCAPYLPELVEFITGFNCVIALSFKYPTLEGRICDNPDLIPRYSSLREVLLESWSICAGSGRKMLLDTFPLCVLPAELVDKMVDFEDQNAILEGWNHEERNREKRFDKFSVRKVARACAGCALSGICEGFHARYVEFFDDSEARPVRSLDELPASLSHAIRVFFAAKARKDMLWAAPEKLPVDTSAEALVAWGAGRIQEALRDCYQAIRFSFEGFAASAGAVPRLSEMAAAQQMSATFGVDAHIFADTGAAQLISGGEKSGIIIEAAMHGGENKPGFKGILTLIAHGMRGNIKVVEKISKQDAESLITTLRFCRKVGISLTVFEYIGGNKKTLSTAREHVADAAVYALKTAGISGPDIELRGFPFYLFPDLHFLYRPPYYKDEKGEIT